MDLSRLKDCLECPICLTMMEPPVKIFQCLHGHVICGNCEKQPSVTFCPTCRMPFTDEKVARNIFAERISQIVTSSSSSSGADSPSAKFSRFLIKSASTGRYVGVPGGVAESGIQVCVFGTRLTLFLPRRVVFIPATQKL